MSIFIHFQIQVTRLVTLQLFVTQAPIGVFCALLHGHLEFMAQVNVDFSFEKDSIMLGFIKQNIEMLKIENVQLLQMDVFQYLSTCKNQYDIIFAGPPYALNTIDQLPKIIVEQQLISPEGYFILEHTPRNNYKSYPGYSFERNYGTTIFSFFE